MTAKVYGDKLSRMGTIRFDVKGSESATGRQERLEREAAMIAEARADVAAGLVVDGAAVEAWIDSIGTDEELPVPLPTR
jgi:hypothetical protein